VSPGPISTPLYGKLGLPDAELQATAQALTAQVPAHRFGDPNEVAQTILFFASDEAPFIVGSELIIDGGMINL
jgi:NAD(P)-dependent dehydrogenase (short-subunit alcohol dehydrogenase family)